DVEHRFAAAAVPDDGRALDELVSPAVIAVVVRVDQTPDRTVDRAGDGVEELAGVGEVEERVYEDGFVVTGDHAGVGPAPAPVRLQKRVRALARAHKAAFVAGYRHLLIQMPEPTPRQAARCPAAMDTAAGMNRLWAVCILV